MPGDQLVALLEDPVMRDALAVVLERTGGGNENVRWEDVEDTLSSGQWGRLIEGGVLVSAGEGFAVAEPGRVRDELPEGDHPEAVSAPPAEIDPEPWTRYDKAAGLLALLLFAGYWNAGLRDVIASVDNVLLGPVTNALPFHIVVLLLATATGVYSLVLQSKLMDTETIQRHRARMEWLSDRKKAAEERGDEAALERIEEEQMEAAGAQLSLFKIQFRPMVWTMLLTVPVFLWLRWMVLGGHLGSGVGGLVVPLAGHVTWQQGLVGPMPTWIVWYFLCSMASRQVIQKILNIRTTPYRNND